MAEGIRRFGRNAPKLNQRVHFSGQRRGAAKSAES
jgi:hypothetical protein